MSEGRVKKWKVFCNNEAQYVTGFLNESEFEPTTCFNNNTHTIDTSKTELLEIIEPNYTKEIIKWKIYCDTEQQYTYGYLDYLTPPTKCFHNDEHIISTHPILVERISNNNVKIQEEFVKTGGNIQLDSHTFDIPAGTTGDITYFEERYPHPINMISLTIYPRDENVGDSLAADVGHHTTIGFLTENIAQGITGGVTGFGVSQTVIDNINIGYHVTLTTGVTSCELGRCVMKNKQTNTISTEFATNTDYFAHTPTYVQQTVEMIRNFDFAGNTAPVHIGADKIGSSYVPTNVCGRIRYTNNDGQAKKCTFMMEYLY